MPLAPITPQDARLALADIEAAEHRTSTARAYRNAWPQMLLWGALWTVGYGAMAVLPSSRWWWVWLPIDLAGAAGSVLLSRGTACGGGRSAVISAGAVAMVVAVFLIDPPRSAATAGALPALMVGLLYVVLGAGRAPRFSILGAAVMALTTAGFFLAGPWFFAWMALLGGGALIAGGLWLRAS